VAKAADACYPLNEPVRQSCRRQQTRERIPSAGRDPTSHGRQRVHFLPKARWHIQAIERNLSQPRAPLLKNKRLSALGQTRNVTFQDYVAHVSQTNCDFPLAGVKQRTNGQSHQIARVWQRIRFVEIVDTPNQTAEAIPPSAEARDMKISNR
jgi:hypothetical protein